MFGTWSWSDLGQRKYWHGMGDFDKRDGHNVDSGFFGFHIKGMLAEESLLSRNWLALKRGSLSLASNAKALFT